MMKGLVWIANQISKGLKDLPPLFFRICIAYTFAIAFIIKWNDPTAFIAVVQSINIPFPEISARLAMVTEGLAVPLFLFGLATRIWCLPTLFLLAVAIIKVHFPHGYSALQGGYQLGLMLFLMVFSVFVTGAGKVSVDALLARKYRKSSNSSF